MKKVCNFIRVKKQNIRERKDDSSDEETTNLVRGTKRKIANILENSTKVTKKTDIPIQRYSANKTEQKVKTGDSKATAEFQGDTEFDKDSQAIYERNQKEKKAKMDNDDGLYKGLKTYGIVEDTKDGNATSSFNRRGPIRAPTNIRSTTRWDYQPDICKDYKETGFCGFGDSCKFLHDRSDYKFGWQLEQEELKCHSDSDESDEHKYEIHSSDDDDLVPHQCSYCREPFTEPVVTKCMHYFCCKCALAMAKTKKGRCSACGKDTEGSFTNADYIFDKLKAIEDKRAKKTAAIDSESD